MFYKAAPALKGPHANEAIGNGLAMINAWPLLVVFSIVFRCGLSFFNMAAAPALRGTAYAVVTLVELPLYAFVMAGVMASMELIIIEKAWRPAAIWFGGKLYFPRFILVSLIILAVVILFSLSITRSAALLANSVSLLENAGLACTAVTVLLPLLSVVLLFVALFLMTFALSATIVDNVRPVKAMVRSCRIVMAHRRETVSLWITFGALFAVLWLVFKYLTPSHRSLKLLQEGILSYIGLVMMATLVYFNRRISVEEARREAAQQRPRK